MGRREDADAREKATGMRQSKGAMTAKIIVGALFVVSGVTTDWAASGNTDNPTGTMTMSIVIGLTLIAWGVLPWWNARRKREAVAAKELAARQAEEARRMNEPKICPACGAATKGIQCEYCGTPLK